MREARLPGIELVVAVSSNDVIGRGGALPWHLPDDLKRFKSLTLGKPVLMGRKTFGSIGRALPGRLNLVLTHDDEFCAPGITAVTSIDAALRAATPHAMLEVIGGSALFETLLPRAQRVHLTLVHAEIQGDTFFRGWRSPEWIWGAREEHAADSRHEFAFTFVTLERA